MAASPNGIWAMRVRSSRVTYTSTATKRLSLKPLQIIGETAGRVMALRRQDQVRFGCTSCRWLTGARVGIEHICLCDLGFF